MIRRRAFLAASAGLLAAPALAQGRLQWRMVTSWPRDLPGPGVSARRIAERVRALTGGRFEIVVHAAGEIVPALGVFDAVAAGTVPAGHTASFFHASKVPAAQAFTTLPFGLAPLEHHAWLDAGGQAIWDRLYAPFGLKALAGGNTGPSMAGWFARAIDAPEDLRGLRIRVAGLGAEMYRRLGASPVLVPPGEIFAALRSGVIDAVEFLGPASDMAQGLHQAARHYYAPGATKPNGSSELLIARPAFEALAPEFRAAIEQASAAEVLAGLADAEFQNARALAVLSGTHGIVPKRLPAPVVVAMRRAADDVLDDLAARDPVFPAMIESYRAALGPARAWSDVALGAYFDARRG